VHRWIRRGFLLWACVSTLWLANSVRTQGVGDDLMRSGEGVTVLDGAEALEFLPSSPVGRAGLVFLCGSGISARAYAPLLRPIAKAGYAVLVVKLPYRFAPFESHKEEAIARARRAIARHPELGAWVISGHSLGAALAARLVQVDPRTAAALVLIGTTHPKQDDLSLLSIPVTKIYATNDGIAPMDRVLANRRLLPAQTAWVAIEGGNHSQFGHYGHQLFDGTATISREAQQAITRSTLLEVLRRVARLCLTTDCSGRSAARPAAESARSRGSGFGSAVDREMSLGRTI
jgi:pimeloyl-ACP methyl ester carboxylesterase